jgi:hypothetical protein
MSESKVKVNAKMNKKAVILNSGRILALEARIIALERGLEAVLRRMEASGQADDEPGWYGRPE